MKITAVRVSIHGNPTRGLVQIRIKWGTLATQWRKAISKRGRVQQRNPALLHWGLQTTLTALYLPKHSNTFRCTVPSRVHPSCPGCRVDEGEDRVTIICPQSRRLTSSRHYAIHIPQWFVELSTCLQECAQRNDPVNGRSVRSEAALLEAPCFQ